MRDKIRTRVTMALKRIIATDNNKISKNEMLNKYVKDQIDNILRSSKLKEIIERVSLQENISKEKALRTLLEKMANETEQTAKHKLPSDVLHYIN